MHKTKIRFARLIGLVAIVVIASLMMSACADTQTDYDTMSKKEYKAACESIDYDTLARDGNNRIGDKVKVYGKVIQMLADKYGTEYQYRVAMSAGSYGSWIDDDIYVYYDIDGKKKLLEDDFVTIYGEIDGDLTYETVEGGERTIPSIVGRYAKID